MGLLDCTHEREPVTSITTRTSTDELTLPTASVGLRSSSRMSVRFASTCDTLTKKAPKVARSTLWPPR